MIQDLKLFCTGDNPEFPKLKLSKWYVDIRTQKYIDKEPEHARLLKKKEINMAFYWASEKEALYAVQKTLKII